MSAPTRRIHVVCDDPRHAPRAVRLATYDLMLGDDGLWYPTEPPTGRGIRQESADDTGRPRDLRKLAFPAPRAEEGVKPSHGPGYARTVFTCPVCRRSFSARTAETLGPLLDRMAAAIDTPSARFLSLSELRSNVHG